MKKYIMILVMIFLSTACTSIPTIPDAPKALADYDAPDWVLKGSGAYSDATVSYTHLTLPTNREV